MFNQNKIKTLLEKINWLSDSFDKNNYSNISALEKSLLKEKVMMFYDEIENIPTTVFKPKSVESKPIEKVAPKEIEQTIPKIEVVKQEVIEELKIPIVEKEPIVASEEKIQTPTVVEQKKSEISKEEKFKQTEQFQKEIAMPKRDIREIIDLNKSFILKAELFNQNNDFYNAFINEINLTRTEFAAENIIKNWVSKLNWQTEENKAYDLLVRAVEKRFLPLIS